MILPGISCDEKIRNLGARYDIMISGMSVEAGDYIKVEFRNQSTNESEWMWVKVDSTDDHARIAFGTLDNEPIANPDLRLGMKLAVSYDNIREHMKAGSFNQ